MSEGRGEGGLVFGANWAKALGRHQTRPEDKMDSEREKLDVGSFSSLEDEGEDTDSPLLGQDEIDTLLPSDSVGQEKKKGLGALVNSQRITVERLPALEGIYERFARIAAGSLRYFTSENVDVTFGKIEPVRFGDYLNSIPLPSLLVIFKADEWESRGLILLDNSLIYSIVDILHGGRRTRQLRSNEGKPYTVIETRMVERMVNVVLNDLASAFDPVSTVNLQFERMENDPRFASIALPTNTAVVADFTIGIDRRSGTMRVVMPYRTLEPVKAELSQQLLGESFGEYGTWARHFSESVRVSSIELEAVLSEFQSTLGKAFSWKRGSIININLPLDPPINVKSGGAPLFVAGMGSKDGRMALRLLRRAEVPTTEGEGMHAGHTDESDDAGASSSNKTSMRRAIAGNIDEGLREDGSAKNERKSNYQEGENLLESQVSDDENT